MARVTFFNLGQATGNACCASPAPLSLKHLADLADGMKKNLTEPHSRQGLIRMLNAELPKKREHDRWIAISPIVENYFPDSLCLKMGILVPLVAAVAESSMRTNSEGCMLFDRGKHELSITLPILLEKGIAQNCLVQEALVLLGCGGRNATLEIDIGGATFRIPVPVENVVLLGCGAATGKAP